MSKVFIAGDNIITSFGFSTAENWAHLLNGVSGISQHDFFNTRDTLFASVVDSASLDARFENLKPSQPYTRFEKMIILSIGYALKDLSPDIRDNKTLIIISSTKGNIDLLENDIKGVASKRVYLSEAAKAVQKFYSNPNTPLVISNACISGVLAILLASRLIKAGAYDNVIVSGADIVSGFVVSGFQSLKALSGQPCRPFDKDRQGLNLGEGCGTLILSSNQYLSLEAGNIEVIAGASRNDANHISGPSREGEGLFLTMQSILKQAGQEAFDKIGYISAHGTATIYNDEMEANAITRMGMQGIPVNSLKGYFGHTLGAAGVIESVAAINALKHNVLLKSHGFNEQGVTKMINIISETKTTELESCLKLASGFGGCNAGVVFSKI